MKRSIKSLLCPTAQRAVTGVAIIALTGVLGMPAPAIAKEKSSGKPVAVKIKKINKNKEKEAKHKPETKHKTEKHKEEHPAKHSKVDKPQHNAKTVQHAEKHAAKPDKTASKHHQQHAAELVNKHTDKHTTKHSADAKHAKADKHKVASHQQTRPAAHSSAKATKVATHSEKSVKPAEKHADKHNKQALHQADTSTKQHKTARQASDENTKHKLGNKTAAHAVSYEIPRQVGVKSAKASVPAAYQAAAAEPKEEKKAGRVLQVGKASYYSDKFDGGRTASGERFDQDKLTCAHGSLPFGCKIRVTNLHNNRSVEVKVNDRGGFSKYGRVVDLSKAAAREIGLVGRGTGKVKVELVQ